MKNIFLFIAGLIAMASTQAQEYNRPNFTLELTITGVGADVRLNDISVEFEKFSGHSTMTFDVNESVISGINELKIITFPFLGATPADGQTKDYHPEAEVKATLFVSGKGGQKSKRILTQVHLQPSLSMDKVAMKSIVIDGVGDVKLDNISQPLSFPTIKFDKQITAIRKSLPIQQNFPRWAWQDGQRIENTKENYNSLLEFYRIIHNAYKTDDRNKLFELYGPAAKEFAKAYQLKDLAEGHKFIETGEILDKPNFELYDFHTNGSKLDVFANGKLARIVDAGFYHPVVYLHKTEDLIYKLKFAFYKNQNNEWVMIR